MSVADSIPNCCDITRLHGTLEASPGSAALILPDSYYQRGNRFVFGGILTSKVKAKLRNLLCSLWLEVDLQPLVSVRFMLIIVV
jgi:hypothetical protein